MDLGSGKELLLETSSYKLNEKSSLVPTVMLSTSKACLRCYGRTHASLGGSIEGCCGFPIWQGRQTLSVPA